MRALLSSALLVLGVGLLPSAPTHAAPALRVDFQKFRLDNGLTVILHEDHRVPSVTVNLLFRVGSKDERRGRSGFAHLFEHLMFMGTRAVKSGEFDRLMESAGGANDADTTEDRTSYYETGPANLLETFLYLEADRLASLDGEMTQAKLDLQREVVLNERRQSYDEKPYAEVELTISERLFPEEHPYHHPVIGSVGDLRAASVGDVVDFFRAYYAPSNAQLVITGDFAPEAARRMVERYFGWLPRLPEPPHATDVAPPLARSDEVTLREAVELPHVTIALSSPRAFSEGDAECELLAAVLGMGKASRLHRGLVQGRGVAQSVEASQHALRYGAWLSVSALGQAGRPVGELERALEEELARLVTSPPTESELARARALVQTQLLRRLERASAMADELNLYEFHLGDPAELARRALARYDEVRPEDLLRVAKQWIAGTPRLLVRVLPSSELPSSSPPPPPSPSVPSLSPSPPAPTLSPQQQPGAGR